MDNTTAHPRCSSSLSNTLHMPLASVRTCTYVMHVPTEASIVPFGCPLYQTTTHPVRMPFVPDDHSSLSGADEKVQTTYYLYVTEVKLVGEFERAPLSCISSLSAFLLKILTVTLCMKKYTHAYTCTCVSLIRPNTLRQLSRWCLTPGTPTDERNIWTCFLMYLINTFKFKKKCTHKQLMCT